MRRLRLFKWMSRRRQQPTAARTVEIVFRGNTKDLEAALDGLARKLGEVEWTAKRAEKAVRRFQRDPWWVCTECGVQMGSGHEAACLSRGKNGYVLPGHREEDK